MTDDRLDALIGFALRLDLVLTRMAGPGRGRDAAAARMLGVSRVAVHVWRTGRCYPEVARAIQIAEMADVSLDWLLRGIGPVLSVAPERRAAA